MLSALSGMVSGALPESVIASLIAGLATGVGALPVLLVPRISERLQDTLLGFSAGIMLAASFFSLIIPALAEAEALYGSPLNGASAVVAALLIGAAGLWSFEYITPHLHFTDAEGRKDPVALPLIAIAITLHNIPEGLAVGVGYGAMDGSVGANLAIAIGIQNMPEGLAVAVSLIALGWQRSTALLVAFGTGLVEPLGALIGVTAVGMAATLLPWGLGIAAGAMIFVISHEIIPETHRKGHENSATTGLLVGLGGMVLISAALG
jgi:ZIP family zinc transporter